MDETRIAEFVGLHVESIRELWHIYRREVRALGIFSHGATATRAWIRKYVGRRRMARQEVLGVS